MNEEIKFEKLEGKDVARIGSKVYSLEPERAFSEPKGLRHVEYDEGFRQATIAETVDLLHAVLTKGFYNPSARKIIHSMMSSPTSCVGSNFVLYGDTSFLTRSGLSIVQDHPSYEKGIPVMDEESLESRLGPEKDGIRFSEDGSIRAINNIAYSQSYSSSHDQTSDPSRKKLLENPLVNALIGKEGTKKLIELENYLQRPMISLDTHPPWRRKESEVYIPKIDFIVGGISITPQGSRLYFGQMEEVLPEKSLEELTYSFGVKEE